MGATILYGPSIVSAASMRISWRSLSAALRLPPPRHIEADRGDEHGALDDVLRGVLYAQERHAVVEAGHDEGAEEGAGDLAAAAHQAGAADDAGGDRVELHERAGIGRGAPD